MSEIDPYTQQTLTTLRPAQRRLLAGILTACLDGLKDVAAAQAAPCPEPAAFVAARKKFTDAITALAHLLGEAAVAPELRQVIPHGLDYRGCTLRGTEDGEARAKEAWGKAATKTAEEARAYLEKLQQAAAAKRERKRHRAAVRKPTPLTALQTEAVHQISEHKGNKTAAAKAMGISRQAITDLFNKAMKKLGQAGVKDAPKKLQRLPLDRRGQENVADPCALDPNALDEDA